MPTLCCHTHCQVAQKAHRQNQNLSISMPALPHKDNKRSVANKKYSAFGRK